MLQHAATNVMKDSFVLESWDCGACVVNPPFKALGRWPRKAELKTSSCDLVARLRISRSHVPSLYRTCFSMPYDLRVAIPTLVGSLLSAVATSCVLISYVVYADQQRSFRHALVLNLALAEFINSLNNSISGIYAIANRGNIKESAACSLNGWVGQWSVQAADFSILAIALVTLLTITRKTYMPHASLLSKSLICASVWVVPTITSSTAAGLKELKPVSGNWCWISGKRTDLRYALGHGWRFSIIFSTIGIYVYIWIYMRRHFKKLEHLSEGRSYGGGSANKTGKRRTFQKDKAVELRSESQTELHEINVEYRYEVKHSDGRSGTSLGKDLDIESSAGDDRRSSEITLASPLPAKSPHLKDSSSIPPDFSSPDSKQNVKAALPRTSARVEISGAYDSETTPRLTEASPRDLEREIRKMLLLNAYPVLYILLWLPGILNRLVEAAGYSSFPLTILQSSTQYIGLANAITYGFNERMKTTIRRDLVECCFLTGSRKQNYFAKYYRVSIFAPPR
ncbi:hypothetical protein ACET3X_006503 [Alternaria dauci]|uniref:Glucose receptor Git3-like N-terminal domain-containing protein n=1 Tax=Alternaria dauci TaxID=48095 RepID=A0ABR3UER0_9PLEO